MSDAGWICTTENRKSLKLWTQVFECIDPSFWAYFGIALAITISIIGAGM